MTASIQQPNPASGLGYWPAFWALGLADARPAAAGPQSGEIDMMEDVNGLNEASQTLHTSATSPGHALIACPGAGSSCQTGYHTYSVIIDRTNTSAETLQFLMDGAVESTITEASVGTTAWQQAIDHGFFIIFDLAMGGNYPNGICGCTTPTSATTSGASMSVGYVAVYEQGGNSTPTATATATGTVKGINGLCLANQNSLNTAGNPIVRQRLQRQRGPAVVAVHRRHAAGPGRLPGRGERRDDQRHQRRLVSVQRHHGPELDAPGQRRAGQPELRSVPDRSRRQHRRAAGHRDLHRLRPAAVDPAHRRRQGNTVTVTNPGNQTLHRRYRGQRRRSTRPTRRPGRPSTYSATGLPAGLSINSSTGLISGTPTTAGTSNVTVTATRHAPARAARPRSPGPSLGGGGCGTTNLALSKTATASSHRERRYPRVGNAVDGNTGTRWSSAFTDPQWLQVDLGSTHSSAR